MSSSRAVLVTVAASSDLREVNGDAENGRLCDTEALDHGQAWGCRVGARLTTERAVRLNVLAAVAIESDLCAETCSLRSFRC